MQGQKANNLIIIYYDGNCALCHGLVKFTLKRIKDQNILFAPIQGETYSRKYGPLTSEPTTIVVELYNSSLLDRSTAIAEILHHLGGFWGVMGNGILLFPKSFRDFCYNLIASIRIKLFGRTKSVCPIIPPEQKVFFLP
jgi:predicted DCC family thiol-disulfide oxidoreductase YuxK